MKAMRFLKRAGGLITALLMLCAALLLSACGRSGGEPVPTAAEHEAERRTGYSVSFTPLPEGMALSTDQCASAEALFSGLGTAFFMGHSFAISNASAHKDGAWQFIEYVLSADLSKQEFSWPVSSAGLECLIERACTVGLWLDEQHGCQTLSASNAALLRDFFAQSAGAGAGGRHPALIQIMQEEAAKYFAGDKSLDETAAVTQSRARLYLAEQYG